MTYMLHGKAVPRAILKDSPHAKIVFALRYCAGYQSMSLLGEEVMV